MDEQPVQLIKEVRQPLPAAEGKPERYESEYEQNGTASIRRQTVSGWSVITSTPMGLAPSLRPARPSRPEGWPRVWRATIPRSMAVGSVSLRFLPSCRIRVSRTVMDGHN
jgi:hypothetical protein